MIGLIVETDKKTKTLMIMMMMRRNIKINNNNEKTPDSESSMTKQHNAPKWKQIYAFFFSLVLIFFFWRT